MTERRGEHRGLIRVEKKVRERPVSNARNVKMNRVRRWKVVMEDLLVMKTREKERKTGRRSGGSTHDKLRWRLPVNQLQLYRAMLSSLKPDGLVLSSGGSKGENLGRLCEGKGIRRLESTESLDEQNRVSFASRQEKGCGTSRVCDEGTTIIMQRERKAQESSEDKIAGRISTHPTTFLHHQHPNYLKQQFRSQQRKVDASQIHHLSYFLLFDFHQLRYLKL
ncbi:hypothetical protein PM082_011233 [Marasmius tenuissimus]|nr:hypothetical protein PM082_011233 [Marasmius tenuissimus]